MYVLLAVVGYWCLVLPLLCVVKCCCCLLFGNVCCSLRVIVVRCSLYVGLVVVVC